MQFDRTGKEPGDCPCWRLSGRGAPSRFLTSIELILR